MSEAYTLRPLHPAEPLPWPLLLLADPAPEVVNDCLPQCCLWVTEVAGSVVGVCAVELLAAGRAEIRNLAVAPQQQGSGLGKRLLAYVVKQAQRLGVRMLRVSTGNSSLTPLALYQKLGFDLVDLQRHHFTRHYPRPIWENGIPCRHLLVLEKELPA